MDPGTAIETCFAAERNVGVGAAAVVVLALAVAVWLWRRRQPFARGLAAPLGLLICACGSPTGPAPGPDAAETAQALDAAPDVAPDGAPPADAPLAETSAGPDASPPPVDLEVLVRVFLDGQPSPDTLVLQGGSLTTWLTGPDGTVVLPLDATIEGDRMVVASHPQARQRGEWVWEDDAEEVTIQLTRYDPTDNLDYLFQQPGVPGDRPNTGQCGHCHKTIDDDWAASVHRGSASNPKVQDVYAGVAALGIAGGCADCHAPGIDGQLGGRDLAEAEGMALEYGVHCDVCHRVESIDLDAEPGVAGRLKLHRPSETTTSPGLGPFRHLIFGPSHDSPNPRMGSVQRDHFREATLCAGCHEQAQEVLVPGAALDAQRWPSGRLPVRTTYSEWLAGPLAEAAACQSCHMPPDADVLNGGDIQLYPTAIVGIQGGWLRPPGTVRRHTWIGPRDDGGALLALAATVQVETSLDGDELVAEATVQSRLDSHAIPTGEPMRALILVVEARCGDELLTPTGGDAVPDYGGWLDRKEAGDDWALWPGAAVGDLIRVVERPGGYHDYQGHGPFGDGSFDAEARGLPIERVVGAARVVAVDGATVTLDAPLPAGDVAYRVDGEGLPRDQAPSQAWAGAPGFAFARVLTGADGARMVPHYLATDVASDNRLLPGQAWTTTHRFAAACAEPEVTAALVHRPYPLELARAQGWEVQDRPMARGTAGSYPTVQPAAAPPSTGETVELDLAAAPVELTLGGETVPGYAYNGQVPGPEIRARVGDTLVVHLSNQLDDPTSIHWHGVRAPWEMDGVTWQQDPILPGETLTYTFPLTHAGTFWYHPHVDTRSQVDLGLYGALVVEDPAEPAVDQDLTLVFDAWDEEHAEGQGAQHHQGARWPSRRWTVNGQLAPLALPAAAGTTVRARLINASNESYLDLAWPGLRVIATDQGLLSAPWTPERLLLGPGDRAEVEWSVGPGSFQLDSAVYTVSGGPALGDPIPLLDVQVEGAAAAPGPVPWPFSGVAPSDDPPWTDLVYTFSGSARTGAWFISGERFPDVTVEELPLGADVVVEVRNLSASEHPFHLHGHDFEVLSVDGIPPELRLVEDTINVRVHQRVRLRLVADNPGDWMAHCHILPHADEGMMTVLRVLAD